MIVGAGADNRMAGAAIADGRGERSRAIATHKSSTLVLRFYCHNFYNNISPCIGVSNNE